MRLLIILSVALLAGCQSQAPHGYYQPVQPVKAEYPQLTPREPVENYPSLNCTSTTVG